MAAGGVVEAVAGLAGIGGGGVNAAGKGFAVVQRFAGGAVQPFGVVFTDAAVLTILQRNTLRAMTVARAPPAHRQVS
jgi:hypothetical protein